MGPRKRIHPRRSLAPGARLHYGRHAMAPDIGEELPTFEDLCRRPGWALTGVILEFIFSHA